MTASFQGPAVTILSSLRAVDVTLDFEAGYLVIQPLADEARSSWSFGGFHVGGKSREDLFAGTACPSQVGEGLAVTGRFSLISGS